MNEQQEWRLRWMFRNEPPTVDPAKIQDLERRMANVALALVINGQGSSVCMGLGCGKPISGNKFYCGDCWLLQQVADTIQDRAAFERFVADVPECDREKVAEKMKPMLGFSMLDEVEDAVPAGD